ncbi:thiamine pyrophosphate-binding protein [Pseudohoeflea coraliihabitans]|uniref:Thiamine pyrophosphate-binding protein n=1 Tax=Pseudohoeflea coraliihabitans TaxID=2860393 RepID=A0ABS6WIT5_9HYPH|nr:thiamine pyrophosphate-binding protein [Pseudohoeflea sp. DP4N28-3]MBW3095852.1 thiamine pyrophosphate-binding protein [Pseudohoeflea sp. DP4N28-3]
MTKIDSTMTRTADGGSAIISWFKNAGIRHVYSVSGGPINSIYQACAAQGVQLVHTRHEAAAGYMAEAAGRVTGRPAALVVTLGPGVTNAITPALVSNLGGTPLLIVGAQSGTAVSERGAGMSFETLPAMRAVTKWAARCTDPDRLQEYLDIAWRKMWAGRPGPVFIEVPTDVLHAPLQKPEALSDKAPVMPGRAGLDGGDWQQAKSLLSGAKRPLVLIGDEAFYDRSERLQEAVEKHGLPFAPLRLARGIIDERHAQCAGPGYAPCNATLRQALKDSDCVLVLGHHFEFDLEFGDKLGEGVKVIQVASDPELLHRNRKADVAIAAAPSSFVEQLADLDPMPVDKSWVEKVVAAWQAERESQLGEGNDKGLHPVAAVDAVSGAAPDETIFVTSHGNIDFWADARLQIKAPGRYLRAGQSGTLGAEVPYGAGAAFADPDVPVIVFVGDGGVGYHVTELDTAERYGHAFIVVVLDDELWGAIALPQEQSFGKTYEMDLPRRDWAKVAEGLGGKGYLARSPEEISDAVQEAIKSGKPAIIQVPVRSVISPYMAYIS